MKTNLLMSTVSAIPDTKFRGEQAEMSKLCDGQTDTICLYIVDKNIYIFGKYMKWGFFLYIKKHLSDG